MDKRYQVFISSTFLDLREERQAVSQALLRSDCFPAQMENWPAMDAEQMEAIKQIIDECDYFVVISAGKYGSINPETGLSYTEMEYDYAVEIGKPIIRLLHRDPFESLKGSQIENDAEVRSKLEAFHTKLRTGAVCKFWKNADQLESATVLALLDVKKRKPAIGWVRANGRASHEAELEIFQLRERLSTLETNPKNEPLKLLSPYPTILGIFFEKHGAIKGWISGESFLVWLSVRLENEVFDEEDMLRELSGYSDSREVGQLIYDALLSDRILKFSNGVFPALMLSDFGKDEIRKARLRNHLASKTPPQFAP